MTRMLRSRTPEQVARNHGVEIELVELDLRDGLHANGLTDDLARERDAAFLDLIFAVRLDVCRNSRQSRETCQPWRPD